MMSPVGLGALALLGGLGLVGAGLAVLPPAVAPETLGRGAAIYARFCAGCHGAVLEGRIGPPLGATGHAWRHADAVLVRRIARGGAGMPGFAEQLDAAEIAAVLAHVKSSWPAGLRAAQAALPVEDAAVLAVLLRDPDAVLPADCAPGR
jgi:mono/diheme cytochrome c family protein